MKCELSKMAVAEASESVQLHEIFTTLIVLTNIKYQSTPQMYPPVYTPNMIKTGCKP